MQPEQRSSRKILHIVLSPFWTPNSTQNASIEDLRYIAEFAGGGIRHPKWWRVTNVTKGTTFGALTYLYSEFLKIPGNAHGIQVITHHTYVIRGILITSEPYAHEYDGEKSNYTGHSPCE